MRNFVRLDITVTCDDCGAEIDCDAEFDSYGELAIHLTPCNECISERVSESFDEISDERYESGFNEGVEEGKALRNDELEQLKEAKENEKAH